MINTNNTEEFEKWWQDFWNNLTVSQYLDMSIKDYAKTGWLARDAITRERENRLEEALRDIGYTKLYGGAGESYGRLLQCQRIARTALSSTKEGEKI
jgi:hypothetical protein